MASHDSTGQPSAKKPRLSGACSVSTNMDVGRGACGLLFFFLYIFLLISFFYILKIMSRNLVHWLALRKLTAPIKDVWYSKGAKMLKFTF